MKDERTGLIKIGRSLSPTIRERTLQSDNPLITLLAHWSGTNSDENELHKRYAEKRVRGEWFDLNEDDLNEIIAVYGPIPTGSEGVKST